MAMPARSPSRYRWVVLAIGTLGQGSAAAYFVGLAAITPALQAEYAIGLAGLGAMVGAPTLGLMTTQVAWGTAVDRFGDRTVMTVSLGLGAGVLAAVPFLPGIVPVLVALFVAGAAVAGANTASGRVVMQWFGRRERGQAMAVRTCALPGGAALSAVALPLIAAEGGTRAAFWSLAGFIAFGALAALVLLRDPAAPVSAAPSGFAPSGFAPSGVPERMRLRDAVRNRSLLRLCVVAGLLVVPQIAITGFGIELLIDHAGVSPVVAAQTLVTVHLAGAGTRLLIGWWADQLGNRLRLLLWIAVGMVVAFTGFAVVLSTGPTALLVQVLLVGVGAMAIGWNGLVFVAAGEMAPPGRSATFLGIVNTALHGMTGLSAIGIGTLAAIVGWHATMGALVLPALIAATVLANPPKPGSGR